MIVAVILMTAALVALILINLALDASDAHAARTSRKRTSAAVRRLRALD